MFLTQVVSWFLLWTTLNIKVPFILRVGRKWKGRVGHNCERTLNIEFEQDWSVGVSATLGDVTHRKLKIFPGTRIFFPGKANSAILLGFECTINLQNLMKIVELFLRKWNFYVFLMWTTLNFEGRLKTKKPS